MTIPSIVFGSMVAVLIGALFHLLRGGGFGHLVLYLLLSLAGFFAGHWVGNWRGWILFPVGPLDLGTAIVGSLVLLAVGDWLSLVNARRPAGPDDAV